MSRPFRNDLEQYRNAPEPTQPPGLYCTQGKQGIPLINGWLGGTTHPIQQHTSMQSTPWPPSCSLTPTTSIPDPPWATLTRRLQDWPASTCLRPNVLELPRHTHQMSRLLQLCPDTPRYVQTTQKTAWSLLDASGMIWNSSGIPGMPGKPGKVQAFWKTIQNTQYIGLGPPSWFTSTPQYVAHVCYLTTCRALWETSCRATLIQIRRQEWMVQPRGNQTQLNWIELEVHRINWTKPEQT